MGSGGTEEALKTIGHGPRFAQLDLLLTGELIAECRMRNLQELVGGNGLYSVPLASKLLFIFDSFREVNSILQS